MMSRPISNAVKTAGGALSCLAAVGLGYSAAFPRAFSSFSTSNDPHPTHHRDPAPSSVASAVAGAVLPTAFCDNVPLSGMRREYHDSARVELNDTEVGTDPLPLFQKWLQEAINAKVIEPNAMCLSTCAPVQEEKAGEGSYCAPTARIVLLKKFDQSGFVWFTNYESRKGGQLAANPHAALTFWWGPLECSVRIEGRVERVSDAESDQYFSVRPRGSQIGAWASAQSQEVASRAALDEIEAACAARFAADPSAPIPRPPHWGGYRLVPARIEFWKGRHGRMHDRIVFERAPGTTEAWTVKRLQP